MKQQLTTGDRNVPFLAEASCKSSFKPMKYEAKINCEVLPESTDQDKQLRYIDISSVDCYGQVSNIEELVFAKAPSRARRIPRAGDTIVSTVRTYLQAIAYIEQTDPDLVCSTGFAVVTPGRRLHPRFLFYWFRSAPLINEICARSTGISYPAINASEIGSLPVPVIPLEQQVAIAGFLDRKTAAIDTLIVKKEQLVAALQEKRQAIITRALPNDNWPIWTVRNLIRARHLRVQDGNHGELHPTAVDYVDNGIPFLMASNVRAGQVDLAGCKFISMERAEQLRIGFAKPGDVLLTHKATLGEVAILPSLNAPYAMLTPQVTYYRPLTEMIDREYLMFVFNSEAFQEQLRFIGSLQSTRSYVSILAQRDLCIPIAPRTRQDEIVVDLQRRCNGLDHALRLTRESIVKLREYRQALITAAVTGQIDVTREEAA